ncbi:MAG: NUDIX hydrolase [Candidatus Daviesbacteria bacterium GW2011_GWB1_39_5]|uniref:NUDIX hydrolase n=1 Tax=Candidatus Daviesbacteria bacterium GW2011_GWC2_40_12 TaxID=1618431 RepID=A0A0G0TXV5_9BACT|nr:MAG: NUDIX hydrolase [Candidatus Daviesbacteria bacterium GW2011_GWF2_38_7]KKR17460.1 MAG: NUDIX hydrolase [Candidatus Daviesbacteria bacterium GW2011_GWA2_39_33]KKR25402.1 MAG: NUDIX hydrolase [Candidatus Daviesbacteria bacterium GW2011_GWB1_39_5]KKR42837.1 MAG: NUDIX hydrolase [Candidatus Daviesbacteria bacterium GW2011_GWC2_40_12]OGE21585.1 MAG: hypothetical protein A2778_05360 [Candidatus Daviesbacteria bacterium RIFCSPHIGHO2_01_FULL_40_24]OGE29078.1 MAG: hypothetical protein A3C29_0689
MSKAEVLIAGVLGVAFNKDNQVLLTKRYQPDNPEEHNKWQLPGGALEFGEHPEDTLKREIGEELNSDARIIIPGPIIRSSTFQKQQPDGKVISYHRLMFAYIIDLANEDINIGANHESSAFTWVPLDALKRLPTLPQVPGIITEALERLNNSLNLPNRSITGG